MSLLLSLWPSNNDLLSIEGLLVNMIRYINQEISHEYLLVGLMLKLKLQYFGHLIQRTDSLEKPLMLGKIEGRRRRGLTEDEIVG